MNDGSQATQLSPQGAARRDAILAVAIRAAQRRRTSRRAARAAAAAAVCVVITGAAWLASRSGRRSGDDVAKSTVGPLKQGTSAPIPTPTGKPSESPRTVPVTIVRLTTENGIATRLALRSTRSAAKPANATVPRLSDEELLTRLAEAGRPAGLAYVDDHPVLLFRNVTAGRDGNVGQ